MNAATIALWAWLFGVASPAIYVPKMRHLNVKQCKAKFYRIMNGQCSDDDAFERYEKRLPPRRQCARGDERFTGREMDGFCDWYGGTDEPVEECATGYHAELQSACYGTATMEGIVTQRLVCHREDQRGANDPCGLDCARQPR